MNWLDLAIIVLAVIFIIIGVKTGFMTSILSHFSFGLNCLLSFFLCRPIGWIFNKCGLGGAIAGSYSFKFLEISPDFGRNLLEIPQSELSSFVGSAIDRSGVNGISRWFFKIFLNKPSLYSELHESGLKARTLAQIMSETYSSFFISVISFITSLVLIFILVILFRLLAKKLREVGFIKIVDNILGVFYGIVRCLLILMIISVVIKLLSPISFMKPVTSYIDGSFFGKLIYTQINNFVDNYLNFSDIVRAIFK